jgi:hypothetical protein
MRWLRILFLTLLAALAVVFTVKFLELKKYSSPAGNSPSIPFTPNSIPETENLNAVSRPTADFAPPLDNAISRITKKPFGIFITPKNSPVQPEIFTGYHTGTDFEIFPGELNQEVAVKTICQGKLLIKEYASGYGGVAVQNCSFNDQPITVIYGHLRLNSLKISVGQNMEMGNFLGFLGKNNSTETDGERKHLHLGIHKGSGINIRGYVSSKKELSSWIDPNLLIFKN